MILPDQPWARASGGAAILAALDAEAGTTRLVGGAVRDALLGVEVKDIDLATRLAPDDVVRRLKAAGLKAVPTGIAHGTITAVAEGTTAEVTTLRKDISTDGRHAVVAFTDDWCADASRRDFSINALYATLPDGELSDFFGGLADLAARRVRFIGAPLARIAEDHLRILRFFRFSARFAAKIDAEGLAACAARANDLMALSRERIASELRGLLGVADPVATLALMLDHAILAPVLPEIAPERLAVLATTVAGEASAGLTGDWRRRLAALLPQDRAIAESIAARLRLSNADRARIGQAVVPFAGEAAIPLAWSVGVETAIDRMLIAGIPSDEIAAMARWQRPRIPASGRDLIERGLAPGPLVAARLAVFERDWVAAGFPQDAAAVAALLDRAAATL